MKLVFVADRRATAMKFWGGARARIHISFNRAKFLPPFSTRHCNVSSIQSRKFVGANGG